LPQMMNNMGFPKLELGLSAMRKDRLADSLAFNSLKVCTFWLHIWYFSSYFLVILTFIVCSFFCLAGFDPALKAQKDAEDESYQIAFGNLRSEVITLRNEALAKDKILLSLVERLKSSETKLSAQTEAHKAEVEELKKEVAKATKYFNVELTKREISDIERQEYIKMLKSFVKLEKNSTM
jgi:Na+/phosphate symporter